MAAIKRNKKKPLRKERKFPQFPSMLKANLEKFFDTLEGIDNKDRIAIFELNNTLLLGSITDAAVAYLLENEIDINFKWSKYQERLTNGKEQTAYIKASQAFAGMEIGCVKRFADVVLNMKDDNITFFEDDTVYKVAVPRINPHFKLIVNLLKEQGFKIYVVSMSNQYLVETVAARLAIPAKHCLGIKHKMTKFDDIEVLSTDILEPIHFSNDTIQIYKQQIAENLPLFFAGSSDTALALIEPGASKGFILWTGNKELGDSLSEQINVSYFINYRSLFKH